jgi:CBS-domain-containing membrane protein
MDLAIERLESLRVADVMTRNVVSVRRGDSIAEVVSQFLARGISSAPVVDDDSRCVGMVSLRHLMGAPAERLAPHDRRTRMSVGDSEVGEPSRNVESESAPDATMSPTVEEVMNHGVQTVAPETAVIAAAKIMCLQHTHRLVVLDHQGRPAGIVSSMDIVSTLVNAMEEMRHIQLPDDYRG